MGAEVKAQKTTTGIPGYPVVPRAREILMKMMDKYLQELTAFKPDAPYRTHMEKVVQHRLGILRSSEDVFELERRLGAGQLEEQIEALENEFKLVPFLLEHKPWEVKDRWHQPFVLWSDVK